MKTFIPALPMTAVLVLLSFISVTAQKIPMKYGKIDPAVFEMKSYEADTSAEALILGDYGEAEVSYNQLDGFILTYTHHCRIKIFKKSAYDLATHSIILYNNGSTKEEVLALKGCVYNMENGKIVESGLEKSMIRDEVIDRRNTERKFTLPNVREGSILEYTVTLKSTGLDIPDWEFQHTIPALWSEYRVDYPEWFQYKTLMKGYLSLDENESTITPASITITETARPASGIAPGSKVSPSNLNMYNIDYQEHRFRMVKNNVPAFDEEPFMNALDNYLSCIQYELASFKPPHGMINNFTMTWERINEQMLEDEDFGLQINRSGFLKDIALKLKTSFSNAESQTNAAFEYVKNQMKWNGLNRVFTSQSLRNSWENKSGNSADINLMLVALLKETGIDAEPVILSTRSNGMVHPGQIMLGQFNYVIASAKIGDRILLMDATEKTCPYNMLTPRCVNGQGRIISKVRPGWIDLNSTHRFEYTNMITASVDANGTITGKMQRLYGNYAALDKRNEIAGANDHEAYISELEDECKGLSVTKFEFTDLDSLYKPLKEDLDVEIADASFIAGNLMTISPVLYPQWTSNPFKMEARTYPVDFIYPRLYRTIITFQLPAGYTVDEKPDNINMTLPDGKTKFVYRLGLKDNTLQVMSTLDIAKSLYTAEEYTLLKEFYTTMVNKETQKVVLKKTL